MITVAIIEDHEDLRSDWVEYLNAQQGMSCIGDWKCCEDAMNELPHLQPDVILMDIEIPEYMSGIECVTAIKPTLADTAIVMVTIHNDDNYIFESLKAGACGYLLKNSSPDELVQGIKIAKHGALPMSPKIAKRCLDFFQKHRGFVSLCEQAGKPVVPLTARQKHILNEICSGKAYAAIADELGIAPATVADHMRNIFYRLNALNAAHAAYLAGKFKIFE